MFEQCSANKAIDSVMMFLLIKISGGCCAVLSHVINITLYRHVSHQTQKSSTILLLVTVH